MLVLRPAVFEDAEMLFAWANDPQTRAASFHPEPIEFEGHCRWLRKKLASPSVQMFIGTDGGRPVGVIRFDLEAGAAVLSFTVAPEARGRGFGAALVAEGTARILGEGFAAVARGCVRHDNAASRRCFVKAGFDRVQDAEVHGVPCAVFERRAPEPAQGSGRRPGPAGVP